MKEKFVNVYNGVKGKVEKHSPEILMGVGVVGVVTGTVMACRATLKLNDILEEARETRDKIKEVASNPNYEDKYTEEDAKKDLAVNCIQTGVKVAKLYAPAVAVGVAGVGCVLASHDIMKKRNVALSAAYLTVDKSFKEYKQRVVDRLDSLYHIPNQQFVQL